jgi:hypothetical protein
MSAYAILVAGCRELKRLPAQYTVINRDLLGPFFSRVPVKCIKSFYQFKAELFKR